MDKMLAQNICRQKMKSYWVKDTNRKIIARSYKLWWSLQLCGRFVVDHNSDVSQWCRCWHFF